MTTIQLKPFDPKVIDPGSILCIMGKRRTGKSFLIKDILYHMRDIPIGKIISHTDHLVHFYDKFIPGILIYREYDSSILQRLFNRQNIAIHEKWENPNTFLLLEDCFSDSKNWSEDKMIKEIFFNGRHYKILSILSMQTPMEIPLDLRINIDYTFIMKNDSSEAREKIYKNYAGMFPSKEVFDKVLDACTEDYHCVVINNTTTSNKLEDQVFIYKASSHEDFRMCSEDLWELNKKEYITESINSDHQDIPLNIK